MEFTLKQIANLLNGKIVGDETVKVKNISPIDKAKSGDITFLTNKKYVKYLKTTKASAVIVEERIPDLNISQIVVDNPYLCFAKLLTLFTKKEIKHTGVSEKAIVSKSAKLSENITIMPGVFIDDNVEIGENTVIYPNVFIGKNCKIGKNCIIYANVSIYHDTIIGNNVIIHSGTVIGSDGFGFAKDGEKYYKIPQVGKVIIEDDVEIGANCTIDRGALEFTKIGRGTKIDNLVQVGHNVTIGKECILVSHTAIGGSAVIEDYVMLAGQVGVAPHARIKKGAKVAAKSGVTGEIPEGAEVAGIPAIKASIWRRAVVIFEKLPELYREIKKVFKKNE